MAEAKAVCGAVHHGRLTLHCELAERHDGWHKAVYHAREEVTYLGSHHVIEMTETVTWEPVDHLREAVKRIMTDRDPQPVSTQAERQAEAAGDG